jgi:hypothetical protein
LVSAIVTAMAREPPYVFGAARLEHPHVQSSQDTLPTANAASITKAEKKAKNRSEDIFVS